MAFDLVTSVNLVLCVVIFVLGTFGYSKHKNSVPLYIGIAFGFFGISHLMTLLGIQGVTELLIGIRTLGYLTVICALYLLWRTKPVKAKK